MLHFLAKRSFHTLKKRHVSKGAGLWSFFSEKSGIRCCLLRNGHSINPNHCWKCIPLEPVGNSIPHSSPDHQFRIGSNEKEFWVIIYGMYLPGWDGRGRLTGFLRVGCRAMSQTSLVSTLYTRPLPPPPTALCSTKAQKWLRERLNHYFCSMCGPIFQRYIQVQENEY